MKWPRTTAIVLLIFLGVTALLGAVGLLIDPSGKGLELPPEILAGIPFDSFLIPAILLGLFNGILSLVIVYLVFRKVRLQAWLIIFQGGVLIVWLMAEVIMDLFFAWLTIPYLVVAVMLVITGIVMLSQKASG